MRLLAQGREAEIFDLGNGNVLRRYRAGGDPQHEATAMAHARAHGFPVPAVHEVRPHALVLERVDGPTLLVDTMRRPWRAAAHARLLASLHRRLHAIAAPPSLPPAGDGSALLHLDLHPENVLLSPSGPVVIDWTNARRGPAELDVALTWVVVATSSAPLLARPLRSTFVRAFRSEFDAAAVAAELRAACERRLADPTVTPREAAAIRALAGVG